MVAPVKSRDLSGRKRAADSGRPTYNPIETLRLNQVIDHIALRLKSFRNPPSPAREADQVHALIHRGINHPLPQCTAGAHMNIGRQKADNGTSVASLRVHRQRIAGTQPIAGDHWSVYHDYLVHVS